MTSDLRPPACERGRFCRASRAGCGALLPPPQDTHKHQRQTVRQGSWSSPWPCCPGASCGGQNTSTTPSPTQRAVLSLLLGLELQRMAMGPGPPAPSQLFQTNSLPPSRYSETLVPRGACQWSFLPPPSPRLVAHGSGFSLSMFEPQKLIPSPQERPDEAQ